ncbi:MAG: tetratricopeptide repeat protein [Candidatus Sulfotelmatobacter sp.]
MGASKLLAGVMLVLAMGLGSIAQDASPTSAQSSVPSSEQTSPQAGQPVEKEPSSNQSVSGKNESSSRRSVHHIQVPDDDSPAQPAELTVAEAAIETKNYSAAESLLRKLVEHDPASYVAWFDLGFVENAVGKVDDSIAAYRKSVAAKPDVFESNLNLGLQLAKSGQPDAEQYLRAATHLTPTSHPAEGQYRAWLSLAETIEKSKPEEALAAYEHAATLQPKEAEPHLSAGQLFERGNKFADAEQEYKQALALDSRSSDAVIGLANVYMRGRRFPEAEDYLRRLLVAHADSAPVHIQLGRVLAAEGKTDAAMAELQAGIKLSPGDDAAQRDLADLYTSAGKNDLAEAAYRGLLAAHPNEAELHRLLGKALLLQKKSTEAQQEFINAVTIRPGLGEAYGDLAFAAGENKQYPLVIRALDARAKLLPEIPITYFMRASAYDHLRDFKQAAANYHLFLNTASGKYPEQEWQAKHRLIAIEPKK